MNMFAYWRQRTADKKTAKALYAALLRRARQPIFYTDGAVPDTVDGRFDMIALHAYIVMDSVPFMAPRLRQNLFDIMFRDFDRATREMGVGDLSVARHMKKMMQAFKGRYFAYETAHDDPQSLQDALKRNLYRKVETVDSAVLAAMVRYVDQSRVMIREADVNLLRAGFVPFAPFMNEKQVSNDDSYGQSKVA